MRGLVTTLVLVATAFACREEVAPLPEGAVEWSVSASADRSEVQVGEDLRLTLTLSHPVGGEFIEPPGAAFEPFDVIDRSEEIVSPVETKLVYRLAAYRLPEELEIPSLEIRYRDEGGEIGVLRTEPISARIVTSLTPDVTEVHDIKGPLDLEVDRDLSLLWWLLAALVAALLAYLIYRKLRKPEAGVAPAWSPPLPPPDVEAEAALERLREKRLVEAGEIVLFYAELAEIVKRYTGRRYQIPYLERTTSEVLSDLKPRGLSSEIASDLRAILEASDLVKFAKLMPEASQAEKTFALAQEWVRRTRPAPVPTPEPVEATA